MPSMRAQPGCQYLLLARTDRALVLLKGRVLLDGVSALVAGDAALSGFLGV